MTPYADFTYFGLLLLYIVVPTVLLGLFGRANSRWTLIATTLALAVGFSEVQSLFPGVELREIWIVLGWGLFQGAIAGCLLRWNTRGPFYASVGLALLPLVVAKFLPLLAPQSAFGFLGISYVTFRALDVIFSIHDRVITSLRPTHYFGYLFFFPTVSSGPVDRYRRFIQDWEKRRTRREFLTDLDSAIEHVFRGFAYKFLIAALIRTYWMDRVSADPSFLGVVGYMYAYTFYLFFDFAGYSAFAVGLSRLFGIHSPENFNLPFLSRNIRDFWNRWHISLSFWFRDHVYMRFLLTAGKKKWFKGRHTASYLGLFLTFGLMGIWHGPHVYYILYGIYHAALLCGFDWFARWNKQRKIWGSTRGWHIAGVILTFHVVSFGLLLFSGHLWSR